MHFTGRNRQRRTLTPRNWSMQFLQSLGAELVTNGGLEADTTGWSGTGTLSIVADPRTGSTGAASMDIAGANLNATQTIALYAGDVLLVTEWVRKISPATQSISYYRSSSVDLPIPSTITNATTTWKRAQTIVQIPAIVTGASANSLILTVLSNGGAGSSVRLDDVSVKRITNAPLTVPSASNRHTLAYTLPASPAFGSQIWLMSRIRSLSDGAYWLAVLYYNLSSQWVVELYRVEQFLRTLIGSATNIGATNGMYLEMTGSTVTLYTTANGGGSWTSRVTTSDGAYCRHASVAVYATDDFTEITETVLSTGATPTPDLSTLFIGGSITAYVGWRGTVAEYIRSTYSSLVADHFMIAVGGQIAWQALVRLSEAVSQAPTMIFVDLAANHSAIAAHEAMCEALIRKLRATFPSATILMPLFPTWASGAAASPANTATVAFLLDIAAQYDVDVINIHDIMDALHDAGSALTTWYTSPDWTHPNASGMTWVAEQIEPLLTQAYLDGGGDPLGSDLSGIVRLYTDTAAYEAAPQFWAGTNNAGETGTWTTETDTSWRVSSAALSTIAFTGTFTSFGVETKVGGGTGVLEYKIDSGSYTTYDMTASMQPLHYLASTTTGTHTITLRVVSGTVTIKRFIAI